VIDHVTPVIDHVTPMADEVTVTTPILDQVTPPVEPVTAVVGEGNALTPVTTLPVVGAGVPPVVDHITPVLDHSNPGRDVIAPTVSVSPVAPPRITALESAGDLTTPVVDPVGDVAGQVQHATPAIARSVAPIAPGMTPVASPLVEDSPRGLVPAAPRPAAMRDVSPADRLATPAAPQHSGTPVAPATSSPAVLAPAGSAPASVDPAGLTSTTVEALPSHAATLSVDAGPDGARRHPINVAVRFGWTRTDLAVSLADLFSPAISSPAGVASAAVSSHFLARQLDGAGAQTGRAASQSVPSIPLPTTGTGTGGLSSVAASAGSGFGFAVAAALCAILALFAPGLTRSLRLAPALRRPVPFLALFEQPG
jgi:hypothetical protein